MKAIVYNEYGPADVLHLAEVAKPAPKDNEVLIKIHASTVTAGDCNARGFTFVPPGFGFLARLMFGLRRPKQPILGTELAGEIEAVGKAVTRFQKGDQVWGTLREKSGAYAEYICLPENARLVKKSVDITFDEAASIPFGGTSALYFLRDVAKLQPGQKILIIGASGGTGVYAVQLAKYYGAEVTGVCSTANLGLVRSLGADKAVDYTKQDFTQNGETYDVILDMVPGESAFARYRVAQAKRPLPGWRWRAESVCSNGPDFADRRQEGDRWDGARPAGRPGFSLTNCSKAEKSNLSLTGAIRSNRPPRHIATWIRDANGAVWLSPLPRRSNQIMDTKIMLSASWVVVTLIYLYGDVLRICSGDFAKSMTNMNFNQFVWLGIAVLMLMPILMVFLSLVLPQSVSRWANIIMAAFFFLFNLIGLPTYPSLYDKFLLAVSLGFNGVTIWYAWSWS